MEIRRAALVAAMGGLCLAIAACSGAPENDQASSSEQQPWDSQGGNPTHATHSYLTEYAVDQLSGEFPELAAFKSTIVDGANQELHELALSDPDEEALREEAEGTNWSCNHPERIWADAQAAYESGDTQRAYWLTGIVLHWVEDMAVPAHAFHVIHQGTWSLRDNFELLGLASWSPSFASINREDPGFSAPSDYVTWSGDWAQRDFQDAFPGVTYTRTFFPSTWLFISSSKARFFHQREGRAATVATWALRAAVTNF